MEATKWTIDQAHSEIGFKIKHMMFTNVSGKFEKYQGTVTTYGDNFDNAEAEFTADADSINTGNNDRDNHLRGSDFFNSEKNAQLKFKSTSVTKTASGDYELRGDLTLNGITKEVVLPVEYSGIMKDPWGNTKAAVSISGRLNRKDWGINWNSALEAGGVLVGEEVRLQIEIQLVKE